MSARHYRLHELAYLSLAMAYSNRRTGEPPCIQRSVAVVLDLPDCVMTFGTLRGATDEEVEQLGPNSSRVPFIHAWVERGSVVYAPTTIERAHGVLVAFDRTDYHLRNGVKDVRPVPPAAFEEIAERFGLREALRRQKPRFGKADIGDALLAAAGVEYQLSENGALLPI